MLNDPKEIEIISAARQKNVRDHRRSRAHFINIFDDFLRNKDLGGQILIDLGPGQYDFGVLAKERGAETVGIDNDPAVLELGRYKGFEVHEGQLQRLDLIDFGRAFDGLFCKFSLNCFWFWDRPEEHKRFVDDLVGLGSPHAWGWLAPWNGVPKNADLTNDQVQAKLREQTELFETHGFHAYNLTEAQARRYGVNGTVANNALFVRGLDVPSNIPPMPR